MNVIRMEESEQKKRKREFDERVECTTRKNESVSLPFSKYVYSGKIERLKE